MQIREGVVSNERSCNARRDRATAGVVEEDEQCRVVRVDLINEKLSAFMWPRNAYGTIGRQMSRFVSLSLNIETLLAFGVMIPTPQLIYLVRLSVRLRQGSTIQYASRLTVRCCDDLS